MSFSADQPRSKGERTPPGAADLRAAVRLRALRCGFGSQKAFSELLANQFGHQISRQLLSKFETGEVRMTVGHAHILGRALAEDETALISDSFSISAQLEEEDL
jgi:hypothetical protein